MFASRVLAAVACAGCVASAAVAAGQAPSAGDCFAPAFKAGNAEAVAACYAEDAILWFPGGPMVKGRKAIREGFEGYFAGVTIKDIAMTPLGEEAMGKTRTTWGTYAITLVDKASKAESVEHGRYVDVQKKIGGQWLYVVDHPSDDPAPK